MIKMMRGKREGKRKKEKKNGGEEDGIKSSFRGMYEKRRNG